MDILNQCLEVDEAIKLKLNPVKILAFLVSPEFFLGDSYYHLFEQ